MKITQETKEKIFSAASALLAQGVEAPTNEQVREYQGGTAPCRISHPSCGNSVRKGSPLLRQYPISPPL